MCDVMLKYHGVLFEFWSQFYARPHRNHTISITEFGTAHLATSALSLSLSLKTTHSVDTAVLLQAVRTSLSPPLTQEFC